MQNQKSQGSSLARIGILSIFVLLPFHAFFTAWLGSNIGYFDVIRLWKEFILVALSIFVVVELWNDKKRLKQFLGDWLVRLTIVYLLYLLFMALVGYFSNQVGFHAAAYGLVIDARFLFFMLICLAMSKQKVFKGNWKKYVLLPAMLVVGFGLLQSVLAPDFLRHFGYGPDTLVSYQTVDNKPDIVRLQSTLRGPNPLGAYLVAVIMLAIVTLKSRKNKFLFILPSLLLLFWTYSRSAWLGLVVSIITYVLVGSKPASRKKIIVGFISLIVVLSGSSYLLRDNDSFQNVFFHTNEKSTSGISSNEARLNSITSSAKTIVKNPLGSGVGVAGPASTRNTKKPGNITENYFLQLGVEIGIIGLALFMSIVGGIALKLWKARKESVATAVLSLVLGLSVINLFSHAWADDTLAYIFFGLVGSVLGIKNSTKSENKGVHLT